MLTVWRDFDDTLRTFDRLHRQLDRNYDRRVTAGPFGLAALAADSRRVAQAGWPAIDVHETQEAFVVSADLPGFAEGDVSVSVEDGALLIRGERKYSVPEGHKALLQERGAVKFSRKLALPARVDFEAVTAALNSGVLTIKLPKAKDALPRQIAVKAA